MTTILAESCYEEMTEVVKGVIRLLEGRQKVIRGELWDHFNLFHDEPFT